MVMFSAQGALASSQADEELSPWHAQLYLDVGYVYSNNQPENRVWRSKSSTSSLDDVELFLGMADVRKDATVNTRWGFEFGLQAGVDTKGLVTSAPPPADEPLGNADALRHLYRANFTYLFDAGRGLRLTGGLINSYIGFESFLAIDNPNYTRAYGSDTVPYFLVGLEAAWDVSEAVDLNFYLVTGYNYLTSPNSAPSAGLRVAWKISPRTTLTQNLYYGPDQADTSIKFWRFLSDTIVAWKIDRWLLAASLGFGSERQAGLLDQPRHDWIAGALWARWLFAERWSVALRPEFYNDRDGRITGASQFITAYTGTVKYQFSRRYNRLVGVVELRYDRSTGDQGGFYSGSDNQLVPTQSLALLGVMWSFDY